VSRELETVPAASSRATGAVRAPSSPPKHLPRRPARLIFARSPPPARTLHALLLTASPHSAAAPQAPTLNPISHAPRLSQPISHNLSASLKQPRRTAAMRCPPRDADAGDSSRWRSSLVPNARQR